MKQDYMTQEEMDIEQENYDKALIDHGKREMENYIKILRRVKKRVSASWYKSVLDFIDDGEYNYDFSIVTTPVGARQSEPYRFSYVYIDQYCNGGMSGDDFAGVICIPIRFGMYLKYHYNC